MEIATAPASETKPAAEDVSPQENTGKTEPSSGNASAEAILVKARELRDAGSIEEMIALLDENGELLGDHPDASRMRLEQLLKSPKPDYNSLKRAAEVIVQNNSNDVDANYALGLYWANTKKSDLGKSLTYLGIAKSSKKPPAGISSLYWTICLKKYWYLALLPLAGLAFGAVKLRKRRRGTGGSVEPPGEQPMQESEKQSMTDRLKKLLRRGGKPSEGTQAAPQAADWKTRVTAAVDTFRSLLAKLRRNTAAQNDQAEQTMQDETPAATTTDGESTHDEGGNVISADEPTADISESINEADFAETEGSTSEEASEVLSDEATQIADEVFSEESAADTEVTANGSGEAASDTEPAEESSEEALNDTEESPEEIPTGAVAEKTVEDGSDGSDGETDEPDRR